MRAYRLAVQYIEHSKLFELRFNFNGGIEEGDFFYNKPGDLLFVEKVIKIHEYDCRYLVRRVMARMPIDVQFFIWWIRTINKLKSIEI